MERAQIAGIMAQLSKIIYNKAQLNNRTLI